MTEPAQGFVAEFECGEWAYLAGLGHDLGIEPKGY